MTPTAALRTRLRKLIDEVIQTGETEADTRFLDSELDDIFDEVDDIWAAAAQAWLEKAGMYQREMGDIEQEGFGQEATRLTALRNRQDYALKMAELYGEKSGSSTGSMIYGATEPDVLGEVDEDSWWDVVEA